MKILFVTQMVSNRYLKELHERTGKNPGFAGQKYNQLLVNGFMANDVEVEVLSRTPIIEIEDKKFVNIIPTELEKGIKYHVVPIIKNRQLYRMFQMIYTFVFVLQWCIRNRDGIVFGDALCKSLIIGLVPATMITRTKSMCIVTDMPGMSADNPNGFVPIKLMDKIHYYMISNFSSFVLISPLSNEKLNPKNKPYIIMEGLVDSSSRIIQRCSRNTIDFFYAGGIHASYGIKMLVEAFEKIDNSNVRLVLYGDGPYVEELKQVASKDNRIEYRGIAMNDIVMNAEYESTFLVNPRPTKDEYTFYSFPSKNIEYMTTGVPVVTNRLAAMPDEYLDNVFLFKDESVEGYYKTLKECVEMSSSLRNSVGYNAKEFIMKTRNNIVQTKRIIDLAVSL